MEFKERKFNVDMCFEALVANNTSDLACVKKCETVELLLALLKDFFVSRNNDVRKLTEPLNKNSVALSAIFFKNFIGINILQKIFYESLSSAPLSQRSTDVIFYGSNSILVTLIKEVVPDFIAKYHNNIAT